MSASEPSNSNMIDVATFKKAGYYFRAGPRGISCNLPRQLTDIASWGKGGTQEFPWSQIGEIEHHVQRVGFISTADEIIIHSKSGWLALCSVYQSSIIEDLPDVIRALERIRAQSPDIVV